MSRTKEEKMAKPVRSDHVDTYGPWAWVAGMAFGALFQELPPGDGLQTASKHGCGQLGKPKSVAKPLDFSTPKMLQWLKE